MPGYAAKSFASSRANGMAREHSSCDIHIAEGKDVTIFDFKETYTYLYVKIQQEHRITWYALGNHKPSFAREMA